MHGDVAIKTIQKKEVSVMANDQSVARGASSATCELARFLARTTLADIPGDVVNRAKYLILDGFGCGLLSAKLDWSVRAV